MAGNKTSGPLGIALPLAAFEAIIEAALADDLLKSGRGALSATREGAIDRARHIIDALADAKITLPDTFVIAKLAESSLVETWHIVPLYPVHFPDGRMMKAVVDPFLRRAPLGLLDWQVQLGVKNVELIPANEIVESESANAAATASDEHRYDVTTKRSGSGTADDCHGLAKLLRTWLKDPSDATQVTRFRSLFGEATWQSFAKTYPKLLLQVQAVLAKS